MLAGKHILVGVCGSIASYKAAELIRLFVKAGAEVKIIMTQDATTFITPLTLATLSKNPVLVEFKADKNGTWNNHIELGLWADIMIIAPCSANTLAKFANGLCDNLLTATYLSARCKVFFAPAMDLDMWQHASTKRNLSSIKSFGNILIKPESGELASGLYGEGRLAEPQTIFEEISSYFRLSFDFANLNVLITAGPTYEAIDPVRYIGNHSSGKMGYAIAEEFASRGAIVTLISGPSFLSCTSKISITMVTTADEMFNETIRRLDKAEIIIMSAAVADYTPVTKSDLKIKKKDDRFAIEMKKTKDILLEVGQSKKSNQFVVGFALETNNALENARKKLIEKNCDMVVLNSLEDSGAGFTSKNDLEKNLATNKITILLKEGKVFEFQLKNKNEVAKDIVDKIKSER